MLLQCVVAAHCCRVLLQSAAAVFCCSVMHDANRISERARLFSGKIVALCNICVLLQCFIAVFYYSTLDCVATLMSQDTCSVRHLFSQEQVSCVDGFEPIV